MRAAEGARAALAALTGRAPCHGPATG